MSLLLGNRALIGKSGLIANVDYYELSHNQFKVFNEVTSDSDADIIHFGSEHLKLYNYGLNSRIYLSWDTITNELGWELTGNYAIEFNYHDISLTGIRVGLFCRNSGDEKSQTYPLGYNYVLWNPSIADSSITVEFMNAWIYVYIESIFDYIRIYKL
jgi:hypothetical protein